MSTYLVKQFEDMRDENVMDFYSSFPKGGDNGAFIEIQEELGTRSRCQLLVDHGKGGGSRSVLPLMLASSRSRLMRTLKTL